MKRAHSIESVAGEVCTALRNSGVNAALVGGAVVSIYTTNEYQSFDLDFVVRGPDPVIVKAMAEIGFKRGSGRHFERQGTPLIVEFLPSPAGIGRAIVRNFATMRTAKGLLTLFDPTHCVMDRLAAFYHWGDRHGLDQALMVARRRRIRLAEIKRWSRDEGKGDSYAEFLAQLKRLRRERRRQSRPGKARKP